MRPIVAVLLLTACGGAPAKGPATTTSPSQPSAAPAPATPPPAQAPLSNQAPPSAPGATDRLPIGSGAFGTAGPTYVRRVDPHERWMALCQARSDTDGNGKVEIHVGHHGEVFGDRMDLYLVLGGGNGTPIDALPGSSSDGRWLAIVRDKKVELVDGQTGDVFALRGADAESDGRPGAPHRAAMFAKDRLLYIRKTAGDDVLVVHDPATHAERELPVPGRLWRIDYGPDRLAHIYVVPRGQGFPQLQTTLDAGECIGPPMSYSTYGNRGPRPTEHWLDLDTGKEVTVDGGKIAVGATIVRTPDDGALYFDAEQIAPPSCRVHLLAVMPQPVRAIAICGEKKQAKVLLLGKGLRKELASIDREDDHYSELDGPSSTGVVCGGGLHCVAAATNQPIDLRGGVAAYAWGNKLYVAGSSRPEIVDVVTGARTPIPGGGGERLSQGKFVLDHHHNVIDLDRGKLLGKVPGAMRLSANGRGLVEAAEDTGPLRWVAP